MSEDKREQLRDAVIDTFKGWGGYWNVSPAPPGTHNGPEDRWLLRVHSRPIVRADISAVVVEAYLRDPSDPETLALWEAELRPIFERASDDSD